MSREKVKQVPAASPTGIAPQTNSFSPLFFTALFCLLALGLAAHHEMWRDEMQAWLLARDSVSFQDLLFNLKYEPHPELWHALLFFITRFTHNPFWMQIVHAGIATLNAYLLLRFAPFSKLQKALLLLGYFLFYEYSVKARCYALGITFVFLFNSFFPDRKNKFGLLCVFLFLLTQTSFFGCVLALCLGAYLVMETRKTLASRELYSGVALLVLGVILSAVQIYPPPDFVFLPHKSPLLASIQTAFIPLYAVMDIPGLPLGLQQLFSALLVLAPVFFLRDNKRIVGLYLLGICSYLFFFEFVCGGRVWHFGHIFILLITCFWLYQITPRNNGRISSKRHPAMIFLIYVFLISHAAAGLYAGYKDWKYPYSGAKDAAQFIRENHLDQKLIVGDPPSSMASLSGYLDNKIYSPLLRRKTSFNVWKQRGRAGRRAVAAQAKTLSENGEDVLIVLTYDIRDWRILTQIQKIAEFKGETKGEDFYLFQFKEKAKKKAKP
jgi:hypothetical protein